MKKKTAAGLAEPPEPAPRPPTRSRHWLAEWTVNVLVLLFAFASVAQPFVVPTSSMENSILIGDHIIVDKLSYAPAGSVGRALLPYTEVSRGDMIVFRFPLNLRENYVKRVIGVPGDRIRIERKQLFLNGKPVQEPYKFHKTDSFDSYRDNFPSQPNVRLYEPARVMLENNVAGGELVVPPNSYFAMGDNRDESLDSRYWGFVPRENIVGKPWLIYWSYDAPTGRLSDPNVNLRHVVDIGLNFFTKTRWSRTFQVLRGYPLH